MATESPRRPTKFCGIIVKPQPVSDKSVMESVVDFFQDLTLTKAPEDKEKICWVQFEQLHSNESLASSSAGKSNVQTTRDLSVLSSGPTVLLILGYISGAQIWHISANGEAQEVLTLKKGPIRSLKFLLNPIMTTHSDLFATKRPLVALTDSSGTDQAFTMLRILSLKYAEEVYSIPYHQPILDVMCNQRVVVVMFLGRLEVLDSKSFKLKFSVADCALSPGTNPNPVALGSRWLAYADKNLSTNHQSGGGVAGEGVQSYTASIICAAKTIKEGITALGETLAGSMSSSQASTGQKKGVSPSSSNHSLKKPGVVSILDVMRCNDAETSVHDDWGGEGLVAHFVAHSADPVTSLTFDPSGVLLVTSDQQGRYFHLFKVLVHPQKSSLSTVHHLYVLHRGDTTAKIQSVSFTWDARWVAVSTVHGTTHVFPVTSYGGPVNRRTHMSKRVVSRSSRFHRSAGLDESVDRFKKSGRDSPAASGSTPTAASGTPGSGLSSTPLQLSASPASPSHMNREVHLVNQLNNPRRPPYPCPIMVQPLAQIRQSCATIPGLDISAPISCSSRNQNKVPTPERRTVVACFSTTRVLPAASGSPCVSKERTIDQSPLDSLFVATTTGVLTEYVLNVRPRGSLENVTDDSPIEAEAVPKLQWVLGRFPSSSSSSSSSGDIHVPHSLSNPLLSSAAERPFNPQKSSSGTRSRKSSVRSDAGEGFDAEDVFDEEWLSQVEIATHAPPYRRLWMGPQFNFHVHQGGSHQHAVPLVLPSVEADRTTASSSSSSSSLSKHNQSDEGHELRFSRPPFKSLAKDFRRDPGFYSDQPSRESPTPTAEEEEELRASLAEAISDETSPDFLFDRELLDNADESECSDAWNSSCYGDRGRRGLSASPSRSSDSN